ncbi:hypothetical protein FOZ63_023893 [Perkinsus olseni]|uniref:Uncharacterized protein n=1 Tax=Perkinsus olseni TaxID=32597 RepID=A0A7J6TYJ4_PEROL|nr:hypothetical protein FOZ63_023893 [Perkinsus olseni]KAF4755834.1 hypothetical protein FOZ62_021878 [Perkinsus olseni]
MLSVAELERIQRSRKVKEQWPMHLAITMLLLLPVIALIVAASEEQSICRREETVCSNACMRRWEELVNTLTEEERIDIENEKEEYSIRCQGECDTAFAECSEKPLILYIGVAVLGICTLCTCLLSSLAAALRHKEEVERITRHLEGGEESDDDDEMLSYPRGQNTDGNIITTSSASPAPLSEQDTDNNNGAAVVAPDQSRARRANLSNFQLAQESLETTKGGGAEGGGYLIRVECPNCGHVFRTRDRYGTTAQQQQQALFCRKCEYMIAGIL